MVDSSLPLMRAGNPIDGSSVNVGHCEHDGSLPALPAARYDVAMPCTATERRAAAAVGAPVRARLHERSCDQRLGPATSPAVDRYIVPALSFASRLCASEFAVRRRRAVALGPFNPEIFAELTTAACSDAQRTLSPRVGMSEDSRCCCVALVQPPYMGGELRPARDVGVDVRFVFGSTEASCVSRTRRLWTFRYYFG